MRYELHGTTMQTLAIDLSRGETLYSQTASMAWMTEGVRMDTHTGGGLFAGLKRAIAGGGLFITEFTAETEAHIAFASRFPEMLKAPSSSDRSKSSFFMPASSTVTVTVSASSWTSKTGDQALSPADPVKR